MGRSSFGINKMKKHLIMAATLVAAIIVLQTIHPAPKQPELLGLHYAKPLDKSDYTGIVNPIPTGTSSDQVYGAIVSHHFYVERLIATQFLTMKNQKPSTIVILGPDHFNTAKNPITVSQFGFSTPFGTLYPDSNIIDKIVASGAYVQEAPYENEHSITAVVGMVKAVFPEAKIVPIILKRNITSYARLDELAENLNKFLPQDSLVIASVDFSHHQNRMASDFHDQKSISAIANFDFATIKNLEIDSPQSIYTLEKFLSLRKAQKMAYTHTNQAEYGGNLASEDVTSYLFANFTNGQPQAAESVSVLSFGDMMFDRAAAGRTDLFENIIGREGNFLKGADIISGNLEGPITDSRDCLFKTVSLKFDSSAAKLLQDNNIGAVNLANNHTFDCGQKGYEDTKNILTKNEVGYFDASNIFTKVVNGKKLSFIGYDLINPTENALEQIYSQVEDLSHKSDYLVVNLHWGQEYNSEPSDTQKQIAKKLISHGADAILGHHPHVIQPMEIYQGKPIFYSLGNFIFDQTLRETTQGIGAGIVFNSDNTIDAYIYPYKIINLKPTLLGYDQMKTFCDNYFQIASPRDVCHIQIKQ
jgi:poly-gamma-glutamate synthesis protein (capsule biosynthesis protein)